MSCAQADSDGAYVLGSLSPAERLDFEQHLATCETCSRSVRDLAGLPGLLSRVDPAVLEEPSDAEEPLPGSLLTDLVNTVRRERRRRLVVTAGLAAAAILAVATLVVAALVGSDDEQPPAAQPGTSAKAFAMTPIGNAPVQATLALKSVAWGTKLDLACKYSPDAGWTDRPHAPTYVLFVRTRDGHTQEVGTWRSIEGRTMRLAAATAARRTDIASVEVRTADGRTVLKLDG